MCKCTLYNFGKCGHGGKQDPNLTSWDKCYTNLGRHCPYFQEETQNRVHERCWECNGLRYHRPSQNFYKHCNLSTKCDHEYDHMITDCERDFFEPDTVLVTPLFELCPACKAKGYDKLRIQDIPKSASIMPKDFENLVRRPTAVEAPPEASVGNNTYDPIAARAKRVLASSNADRFDPVAARARKVLEESRISSKSQRTQQLPKQTGPLSFRPSPPSKTSTSTKYATLPSQADRKPAVYLPSKLAFSGTTMAPRAYEPSVDVATGLGYSRATARPSMKSWPPPSTARPKYRVPSKPF